ncbi:hypothetical protein V4F39_06115 [Aquincola sp. MAHUQ-54]|uniref:Lipoprotein n=1 Tax=Aquincola agrisoli TaxID=3119538 RepID=A0AAW9Q0X6_9BURK
MKSRPLLSAIAVLALAACGGGGGSTGEEAASDATYDLDAAMTAMYLHGVTAQTSRQVNGSTLTLVQVFAPGSDVTVDGMPRKTVHRTVTMQVDGTPVSSTTQTMEFTAAPLRVRAMRRPDAAPVTPTWTSDLPTATQPGSSGDLMRFPGTEVRWSLTADGAGAAFACLEYSEPVASDCYRITPGGAVVGWKFLLQVEGQTYTLR